MQNPVITIGWFFGNLQLVTPLVSLTLDTKPFCESLLSTKPLCIMSLVLPTIAYLAILVRTEQFFNPLHFFNFSYTDRWQLSLLGIGGAVFYGIVTAVFRNLVLRYEQRRLSPS